MPAEGTPQHESSLLSRFLVALTRLVLRFPRTTVVACLAAIGVSLFLGMTRMAYHTGRGQLLDPHSDFNRRWLAYTEEFGSKEDVVVVVEGPSREVLTAVIEDVAAELARQRQHFQSVLHKVSLEKIQSKGLHYLPVGQLQTITRFLNEMEPVLQGGWAWLTPQKTILALLGRLQTLPPEEQPRAMVEAQARLMQLAASLSRSLQSEYQSPLPGLGIATPPNLDGDGMYFLTENGRMGFILLKLADEQDSQNFVTNSQSIAALREIVSHAKTRYRQVEIGLTGLPVMESDEMRCSQSSMSLATVLSFLAVVVVLVAGFGGIRHPVLAMAVLVVGMIWSLGFTAVAVGHLNILSSAFGAILVGLGSDYAVYYVARYLQLRHTGQDTRQALLETAESVVPGITVGASTTAIAFFMAGFTEFKGVAELGVIAGGGIVLCWLATVSFLPAVIYLFDVARPQHSLPTPLNFHRWIEPLMVRPVPVLLGTLAATGCVAVGIGRLQYDHNLLNLQPAGLESVNLERILSEMKGSAWFALSVAKTPEEALARKARFEQLPSVARVEELASRLPGTEGPARAQLVAQIHTRLVNLPAAAPILPLSPPMELAAALQMAQQFMAQSPQAAMFQQHLEQIGAALGGLGPEQYNQRLTQYQQSVAEDVLNRLRALQAVANPQPPQLSDLPQGLVSRLVGKHGHHLLKIYAKDHIWDMEALEQFVGEIRSVDPEATGNPLQVYEASHQMKRSYEQCTWLALAAILPVVYLNFGNLRCSLLALLPLTIAVVQTYGLMGLLNISPNSANMIALPLMLGMGMDNGIHVVQDYLSQRGRYRMSVSTGVAVVLNTLTTMVGFAALILADHRGLQSLGRVLTIGMSCCLFSAYVILPALLTWMSRETKTKPEPSITPEDSLPEAGPLPATVAELYRRLDLPHAVPSGHRETRPKGLPSWEEVGEPGKH